MYVLNNGQTIYVYMLTLNLMNVGLAEPREADAKRRGSK